MAKYVPGAWFAVLGDHAAALFPPEESARVAAIWDLVQGEPSLSDLLDAFLRDGLAALPSFALAAWSEDGLGVVLRGPVSARAGADSFDGSGISTWVERRFEGPASLTLVPGTGNPDASASYAVRAGVVLVDALVIETAPGATGSVAPPTPETDAPAADRTPSVDPHATFVPGPAQDESQVSEPSNGGYDDLFGATIARHPEEAAIRSLDEDGNAIVAAEPEPAPEPAAGFDSEAEPGSAPGTAPSTPDHDGRTVFGARAQAPAVVAAPAAPPRLSFSGGEACDLNRVVIVGRAPEARRFQAGQQPRLVVVVSPQLEVSGTHLEIREDDGRAVATDLHSTNGTVLTRPGEPPMRLTPGEPVPVPPGSVLDLGDGVSVTVLEPGARS